MYYPPKKKSGLIVSEVENELIVYDKSQETCHKLNPTASVVFTLCTGDNTVEAIILAVAQRYDLDPNGGEATLIVNSSLSLLSDTKLLVEDIHFSELDKPELSRRDAFKQIAIFMGATAATFALAPVIQSVIAPDAKALSTLALPVC